MNIAHWIQQKSEAQRRIMMFVTMFVLSGAIVYVWFSSLDLDAVAQNPIEQIAQTGNTKEELTPLRSLWLNTQILGDQFRKAKAGLNLIKEKIAGVRNDAVEQNQQIDFVQENKKSFFGMIKDVLVYNVGILKNILQF